MGEPAEDAALQEVAARTTAGGTLVRAWPLHGGVSAQLTALEIALPSGRIERLVLRRHGAADLAANPDIAADEFRLLQYLRSAGLPVPEPRYVDRSREVYAAPYLVLAYVEAQPTPASAGAEACVPALAACLARIHRVDAASNLSFLPRLGRGYGERPARLDDSLQEGCIREALAPLWPLQRPNRPALLHGDYWPGNVLWRDGQVAAIIDWEDAALGDPLADLGNSRLEILWAFGREPMARFTAHYRSHMPALDYANLPYWDLCAALRPASKLGGWGLDAEIEAAMRAGHRWFAAQALAELPQRPG